MIKPTNIDGLLPPGNCPLCDAERYGVSGGWGLSPEGWELMGERHKAHLSTPASNTRNPGLGSSRCKKLECKLILNTWGGRFSRGIAHIFVPSSIDHLVFTASG